MTPRLARKYQPVGTQSYEEEITACWHPNLRVMNTNRVQIVWRRHKSVGTQACEEEYKPVLLINDSQAKLLELQGVGNECVRAHDDACAAVCQAGIHGPPLLGLGRACEDGNSGALVQRHGLHKLLKLHHVLLCQDLQAGGSFKGAKSYAFQRS